MKHSFFLLGTGLISLWAGYSSPPLALAPVGSNPFRVGSNASTGDLQVFSRLAEEQDDQNQAGDGMPVWYQHTCYTVCDPHGKVVKYVDNTTGHYAEAPARVALPPGRYVVKAESKDAVRVSVPVMIERGRTTRIHLDNDWKIPSDAPKSELVTMPDGNPVGWRAKATEAVGMN